MKVSLIKQNSVHRIGSEKNSVFLKSDNSAEKLGFTENPDFRQKNSAFLEENYVFLR